MSNVRDDRVKPCPVCKAPMEQVLQDYVVEIEEGEVVVEDVPIWICDQCSFNEVEAEVIEAVEDMLAHMDAMLADAEE